MVHAVMLEITLRVVIQPASITKLGIPASAARNDRANSTAFVVLLIEQGAKLGDNVGVILVQPIGFLPLRAKLVLVRRGLCRIGRGSLKLVHER